MHCHCGTNNRAPRWTFTDPCKPEVRPGAREESTITVNSNLTKLHSIPSFCNLASGHLTFVLRPCMIFIVQCGMLFFVLPLFILRPAITLTSSCHHCFVHANCNYTSRWRFTRRWSLKVVVRVRVRVGEKPSWEFKLLIISLFVHGFLLNLEAFILVRVGVCHKLWILPNSQYIC